MATIYNSRGAQDNIAPSVLDQTADETQKFENPMRAGRPSGERV